MQDAVKFKARSQWIALAGLRPACALIAAWFVVVPAAASAGDPPANGQTASARPFANQSVRIEEPEPAAVEVSAPVGSRAQLHDATVFPEKEGKASAGDPGRQLPPRGERRLRSAERGSGVEGRSNPTALGGLWPLLAVTALIGAAYVLLRRIRGGTVVRPTGVMRVLGRLPLSARHQVALVQVGRRILVVGISGADLRTLDVVEDAEEAAVLAARATGGRSEDAFSEVLGREAERFDETEEESVQPAPRRGSGVSELLRKVRAMQGG